MSEEFVEVEEDVAQQLTNAIQQLGLEVAFEALTQEDVDTAWKNYKKIQHPDKFSTAPQNVYLEVVEAFKQTQAAYHLLTSFLAADNFVFVDDQPDTRSDTDPAPDQAYTHEDLTFLGAFLLSHPSWHVTTKRDIPKLGRTITSFNYQTQSWVYTYPSWVKGCEKSLHPYTSVIHLAMVREILGINPKSIHHLRLPEGKPGPHFKTWIVWMDDVGLYHSISAYPSTK